MMKSIRFLATLLLLTACPLVSCSRKETPTAATSVILAQSFTMVLGYRLMYVPNGQEYYSWAYGGMLSDPLADTAKTNVTISWGNHTDTADIKNFYLTAITFEWIQAHCRYGDTLVQVRLTSDLGNSTGSIRVPGETVILSPAPAETLANRDSARCCWSASAAAEWYSLHVYVAGYDSLGTSCGSMTKDTVIIDTLMYIPRSCFAMPNAAFYYCSVSVTPCSGPQIVAGSSGNMTGDIPGFLIGQGFGTGRYFYVRSGKSPLLGLRTPPPGWATAKEMVERTIRAMSN
ncbi:MAG: hypothetical protein QME74_01890 [Candidatus Edwardsbacteria bacterium]|nr:hypothetical protein [Candidatus Edwardsbacteria bacterium]